MNLKRYSFFVKSITFFLITYLPWHLAQGEVVDSPEPCPPEVPEIPEDVTIVEVREDPSVNLIQEAFSNVDDNEVVLVDTCSLRAEGGGPVNLIVTQYAGAPWMPNDLLVMPAMDNFVGKLFSTKTMKMPVTYLISNRHVEDLVDIDGTCNCLN